MNVFIVLDYSFKNPEDITLASTFNTLEAAMDYALKAAMDWGLNFRTHGYKMEGIPHSEIRISNGCNLGSKYGITYKSGHTGNPMAMMVMERKLRCPIPEEQPLECDFAPEPQYPE